MDEQNIKRRDEFIVDALAVVQILGGDEYRLHPTEDRWPHHVDDCHRLVGFFARVLFPTFRMEGRRLAEEDTNLSAMSHQSGCRLSGNNRFFGFYLAQPLSFLVLGSSS